MFEQNAFAVDIGSSYVKLMAGDRKTVSFFGRIKTPENSIIDDKIINPLEIKNVIAALIKESSLKYKKVAFTVHGQDIIVRNIEVPIMDEESIMNTVEEEVKENLPENGQNHYVDFEILEKIENKEKKAYKLLTAAVPKEKIDSLLELSKMLNLELKAVDIASNCAARVFKEAAGMGKNKKNIIKFNPKTSGEESGIRSIGIINIENTSSSISILENGKLFIDRQVPFGMSNLIRELVRKDSMESTEAYNFLIHNFDFTNAQDEIMRRIVILFDNVFSSFDRIIQFYTTGKVKKTLDYIYIIGDGSELKGAAEYVSNYFQCPSKIFNTKAKGSIKISMPKDCDIEFYVNTLGLLLRKE